MRFQATLHLLKNSQLGSALLLLVDLPRDQMDVVQP